MKHRVLSAMIGASLIAAGCPAFAAELVTAERPIPGRYIVVLKNQVANLSVESVRGTSDIATVARSLSTKHRAKLLRSYQHALRGFVVEADPNALAQLLNDPGVAFVEEDGFGSIAATQNNATWGIDRVDQRNLPLSSSYTYDTDAATVHAYILDTGVRADHVEFSGRMGNGFSARPGDSSTGDCHGHGTHVAGTVAGTTWGVAKKAIVHPIRTFDCTGNGQTSEAIAAIDWVAANHIKPAVANMSFSFPGSAAIDNSVNNLMNAGVVAVAAAGNSNDDACSGSPRRVPRVLTVGSSDRNDARSLWSGGQASGWGRCVDLFAPGSDIVSAGIASATASVPNSGTSMASPHVAGVAALYLATHPAATADEVHAAIVSNATPGKITGDLRGSPNLLVHSLFSAGPGPGNAAPVANFMSSTNGLTATFTDTSSDSDGSIASRSWDFGDGTTSTAANPSKTYAAAGTYTVKLTVVDNGGASNTKTATVTVGSSGGVQTYTNGTDANIPDNNATGITSSISVTGRSGNAPSNAQVAVNIVHSYKGDLIVDLVAPDGSVYNLHNRTGSSTDNINQTFTVNLSSEALNGTWKLRAADRAAQDVGRIDSWSVTF
ncbi:peptidase, families S8 and S53/PKD domain/proprotein convertase P-domain protein [Lysobacter enzymogenes]|uniref:Peptidase, families S8 and S53/PKD domain/proprotein convertase P-domain protein n=1 Tax=Lysobacter enzymogenes TaxID=69 RepID=A0A0S2DLK0_LYSEN|nr:S8 family serine peptidase [Lysobacter enzymogenes]ALN59197.1 peptidase, families S8 and S53/PKD domain/proprotein convertase P-domain protein [Lysobacter enzymogenes]QCW27406.1 PKD domain-containing protein [Lysobacter enzymogenes]